MTDTSPTGGPDFHPGGAPHCDFLVSTKPTRAIRDFMVALGARVEALPGCELYAWGFDLGEQVFLGTGVLDGRFRVGPVALETDAAAARPVGTCCILTRSGGGIAIHPDLQGLYALYVGPDFITNRLHLAALLQRELDDAPAIAPFFNNQQIYWDQPTMFETGIAGVSLVAPFRSFVATIGGIETLTTDRFSYRELEPQDYWELVERGAEEICANVGATLDSGHTVVADITGGQDSRILLGALIALGRVDEVIFNTTETPNAYGKADMVVGSGLVREFGGSYDFEPDAAGFAEIGMDEAWELRRSRLFGSYHFVRPTFMAPGRRINAQPIIRIGGACGEIYRNAFSGMATRFPDQRPLSATQARRLFARTGWSAIPEPLFNDLAMANAISLCNLEGFTYSQKINTHHLTFRSRFHFANRSLLATNNFGFGPLFSPSLLQAVRGLPARERKTGRAMFDITRTLCERLPHFPYAKPFDRDYFDSPYHRPSNYDGQTLDLPDGLPLLDRQREKRLARAKAAPKVAWLRPQDRAAFIDTVIARTRQALRAGPDRFRFLGGPAMKRLLAEPDATHEVGRARMASKLQQAVDVIAICNA